MATYVTLKFKGILDPQSNPKLENGLFLGYLETRMLGFRYYLAAETTTVTLSVDDVQKLRTLAKELGYEEVES
jgi:hypothetical protein